MKDTPHGLIKGEVTGRINWTDSEFSLQITADIACYTAGQFTKLALYDGSGGDEGEWIRRAYSFVNSPNHALGQQVMEFLIIAVPDGQLSSRLDRLQVGDDVYVGKSPAGFMTLDEIPRYTKDLWLLSTGTAIGPFLSLLDEVETQQRFDNVVLVHAVRTSAELVYQDKIQHLEERYQGKFHYVPIVSRENRKDTLRGRIPALLKTGDLVNAAGIALTTDYSFFYLCGNPSMVKDTSEVLIQLGYQKHSRRSTGHFNSENYW
ncbi:ferredoxin--NADP reductase [Moritella sp. Urea-trap-13]|uniref:ferredoxin--NADP reductase n=1 Tax=Moritella sp. Urea-trap-13 TaxID=2058327 RepID=UPI000C33A52B|nr:ferredoxin--NADP reductase [Moritella sp. Urea-trap-13]PKH04857.1 ferredoxin--NADP(+) reductase [Moritella sp. Urea-trap-13]